MARISILLVLGLAGICQDDAKDTFTVRKTNLTPVIELEAAFEPAEKAEVRLRLEVYQGDLTIDSVVPHGQLVKRGDVLLSLRPDALTQQMEATAIELRVAEASLAKAIADLQLGDRADAMALKQSQESLREAETELKVFDEVTGKHMLVNADLSVKYQEDSVSDQQEELDQLEKMYKSEELTNATAEIVVKRARRALERSKISLQQARETARVTKEIRHPKERQSKVDAVEQARHALESLKAAQALAKVQREAEVARARANVQRHKEQLEKLKQDLETLTVRSPIDGRVFYGQLAQGTWSNTDAMRDALKPGQKVQAGIVLMTVCGAKLQARADVPEANYLDVTDGLSVSLVPVSDPDTKITGITRGKADVNNGRGFEVRIELAESPAGQLPGMKARATITCRELKDVMVVPSRAINWSTGKPTVQVGDAVREIVAGRTDGTMTEVRSGLAVGDKVSVPK